MAYRGDDLDLRTPQSWSSAGREAGDQPNWWTRTSVYKGGRADPIWVDDHVMASCNHAYDLAVAHRAVEVRLEHLINALTLNDHAAQVLEARGLSVASLRRESGAAISNDIPASAGSYSGAPKRSEGLEEALRLAADHAYPRRTPVTVDDILHVIFDMKRDLPGVQLLRRHASTWSPRNGAEPRTELRLDPLPHLSRPQPAQRPRYSSPAAHDYFSQPAPREPIRNVVRETAQPATVDTFQDARLDSLERAVRDLGVDLADDRKTIRSLVSDLQRSTAAQADDTGRFRGGLNERLASLEDIVVRSRNEAAALPSAVLERVEHIERTIDARISDVGRGQSVPPMILDRLAAIERAIEMRLSDIGRTTSTMSDRIHAIEQVSHRPVEANLSPLISQRLDAITSFAGKVEALERTFQLILDRMTGIERKMSGSTLSGTAIDTSGLERRIAGLETSVRQSVEQSLDIGPVTELLSGIEARVAGLERNLDHRAAETGRTVSFIGERLRSFEEAIGGSKSQTMDRLSQIERSLTAVAEGSVVTGGTQGGDLSELHEVLLKLNANQQTLATTLDQWRLDNSGDLSVINNRLKAVEETDQRHSPQVESMAGQIAAIHATLSKREVRKSRFLNWLFGTDEWYSSSYDTAAWRARQVEPAPLRTAETVVIQHRATPPAPPPSALRR